MSTGMGRDGLGERSWPRSRGITQVFVALTAVGLGWAVSANGAETGEAAARRVCSGCHAVPPPDVLPRSQWRTALYDMAGMIVANIGAPKGQAPLDLDFDLEQLVHYYETRAPLALDPPAPWPAIAPDRFVRHPMRRPSESPPGSTSMVAGVRFLRLEARRPLEVVVADMAAGLVLARRSAPVRSGPPHAGSRTTTRATWRPQTSTGTGGWMCSSRTWAA